LAQKPGEDIFVGKGHSIDAGGNYFSSNEKFVAAIGVKNLIVVETADALLVCPRERAQDVGKFVRWLEEEKFTRLL
jgi:mannose-1-phosphate guanylyltransferase